MPDLLLELPVRWWHCPACDLRDRTQQAGAHTQFHNCPAIGGLACPLVEVPTPDSHAHGRQVVVETEDYAGRGDPITAVHTERADGSNDCTVIPQTATASGASP